MTGKELIIYILENNLENEQVVKDGKIIGFMTIEEAALKLNVGIETINTRFILGTLPGVRIGGVLYIPCNVLKKEEEDYEHE